MITVSNIEAVANVSWPFQTAASLGQYQLALQYFLVEHDITEVIIMILIMIINPLK